jgi:hypothetical protein
VEDRRWLDVPLDRLDGLVVVVVEEHLRASFELDLVRAICCQL